MDPDNVDPERRSVRASSHVVRFLALVVALGASTTACGSKNPAGTADQPSPGADRSTLIGMQAPDFSLRDQFDRHQRLSDYRGKVVLLTFVSSHCKDICPLTAELLARTQDLLGPKADGMQVVAVNANYRFSAVHDVLRWSKQHSMTHRWLFLTAQASTLWNVYNAYGVTPGAAHTVTIFLIDPAGRVQALVPIAMQSGIDDEAKVLMQAVGTLEAA